MAVVSFDHKICIFSSMFYFVSTHSQSFCIFCVICSVQAFPFPDRHGYGCYSGPYQLFYADPKVEESVQNGRSWGKGWKISLSGLEISGNKIFGLSKENTVNYCPNAVKWLYLQCSFQTLLPPEAPTFRDRFVCYLKKSYSSENPTEGTEKCSQYFT